MRQLGACASQKKEPHLAWGVLAGLRPCLTGLSGLQVREQHVVAWVKVGLGHSSFPKFLQKMAVIYSHIYHVNNGVKTDIFAHFFLQASF